MTESTETLTLPGDGAEEHRWRATIKVNHRWWSFVFNTEEEANQFLDERVGTNYHLENTCSIKRIPKTNQSLALIPQHQT